MFLRLDVKQRPSFENGLPVVASLRRSFSIPGTTQVIKMIGVDFYLYMYYPVSCWQAHL